MSSKAEEQWALITGCSQGGMGEALARAFQAKSIKVIATARTFSKIDPGLASSSGVETLTLDVNEQSSVEEAVKEGMRLSTGDYVSSFHR